MSSTSTTLSEPTVASSSRGKTDSTWGHCNIVNKISTVNEGHYNELIATNHLLREGGIDILKEHLAEVKGDATSCKSLPENVR